MATAFKPRKIQACFNDILNNINWDLIKPSLEKTKFCSQDELTSVWQKNEKQRLRYLMKIMTDSDKLNLFIQAFKDTSHDAGHQKVLEILQDIDISGK